MNCQECNTEMVFDHTDYYDFDIYRCPKCGHELALEEDDYLDDEGLLFKYGDDYFEDIDWMDGEE